MILLDTDVMIDILRQHPPAIAWLELQGNEQIVLPGYVVMELLQGCQNKMEQLLLLQLLNNYALVWPTPSMCDQALSVFATYHLSHNIGILDTLIGQLAVNLNIPLYTFNQKHYAAVPDLRTIQPYTK
jgi:predicted nucleic acid-binding protein